MSSDKGTETTNFHRSQSRFINSRIDTIQKHFSAICSAIGGYTSAKAKLRNKGDDVAKSLIDYGEAETLNKTLRIGLLEFSEIIICVQDYRNTAVKRLESGAVSKLFAYERICNSKREELRKGLEARRKEIVRQKVAERNSGKSRSHRRKESSRTRKQLEKQMDSLEEKKIEDLKATLQDFAKNELAFHAKAVELYTKAYKKISAVNSEDDMEEFRNALRGGHCEEEVGEDSAVEVVSPVIFGGRERPKSSNLEEMSKSTEKLQIQDYEEILDYSSSDDE